MVTRDEVRDALRTLPDDYLRRYVNAFETRQLSCFQGNPCTQCAVTVMGGAANYTGGHDRFRIASLNGRAVELFYEQADKNGISTSDEFGSNATPLYDECVLELARRAAPVPTEAVR